MVVSVQKAKLPGWHRNHPERIVLPSAPGSEGTSSAEIRYRGVLAMGNCLFECQNVRGVLDWPSPGAFMPPVTARAFSRCNTVHQPNIPAALPHSCGLLSMFYVTVAYKLTNLLSHNDLCVPSILDWLNIRNVEPLPRLGFTEYSNIYYVPQNFLHSPNISVDTLFVLSIY